MNEQAMDFLLASQSSLITTDLGDLMDDADVSTAITYRDYQSRTRTPSTGAYAATYTDSAIRAVRTELGAREIAAGAGLYQVGDAAFMLAQSDLPATPHREDRIVHGSDTYEVIAWQSDPISKTWRVVARRVV